MLPWPNRPPRCELGFNSDFAESRAPHAFETVVRGEALVRERVIGADEIQQAAVLAHHGAEEQLRFALHRAAQARVELTGR